MPSCAHCHTAGMGRGHRQGLQQEGGIDSWQEPPSESGSWKMLVLGGIAQHPVGAWPAWSLHYPSSPQYAPFPSWVVLILGNSQQHLSSIFSRQEPIAGAPPTPSIGLRPVETGTLPPPEVLSWGSPQEQHYCMFRASVE